MRPGVNGGRVRMTRIYELLSPQICAARRTQTPCPPQPQTDPRIVTPVTDSYEKKSLGFTHDFLMQGHGLRRVLCVELLASETGGHGS